METSNNQKAELFIQTQKEAEVLTKRKFNLFEIVEALRGIKDEESPKPSPKKCRVYFPLSEKILSRRHSDGKALRDSGCKKRRQQNSDKSVKDMFDEFFLSSSTIVKAMKMDEIDEFFTSTTISFKPAENNKVAAGFINKFTTSFAHMLSKEYFDRTTFEDRRKYH
jgi:hypothetical protein